MDKAKLCMVEVADTRSSNLRAYGCTGSNPVTETMREDVR